MSIFVSECKLGEGITISSEDETSKTHSLPSRKIGLDCLDGRQCGISPLDVLLGISPLDLHSSFNKYSFEIPLKTISPIDPLGNEGPHTQTHLRLCSSCFTILQFPNLLQRNRTTKTNRSNLPIEIVKGHNSQMMLFTQQEPAVTTSD